MNNCDTQPDGSPHEGLAIVLGGGIAGLAAADALASAGRKVVILEAGDRIGGMHASIEIGPYSFDLGSIFYEDTAQLLDLAEGLREICPRAERVQRRLTPAGKIAHYPFDPREIRHWPRRLQVGVVTSFVTAQLFRRGTGSLEGACISQLGRVLFEETGLYNYTLQFNGVPPSQVDESFYFDRMRFVHAATRPRLVMRAALRALRRQPYRSKPKVPLRIRPVSGYAPMFDLVRAELETKGVEIRTEAPVRKISGTVKDLVVETDKEKFAAETVVGAMPIDQLHQALFHESSELETLDLLTLFVTAGWLEKSVGNVFFNFASQGKWKRMTVYSRLYPELSGGRECLSVEITVPPKTVPDPNESFGDFAEHLTATGVAKDLRLEGSHLSSAAYPLYRPGASEKSKRVLERIEAAGVIPVGRAGRFDYLPTSTGVIRRTKAVLKENAGEMTGDTALEMAAGAGHNIH